ncbi:MAG: methylated-DNA--[protein]-cysteine S-methyltransferase [Erysipelotrichaceae bacterium]|nr:methylated-DNA--[protein]-cysteine S-methyltransferase [Erysipelotrichaceae bacterium]
MSIFWNETDSPLGKIALESDGQSLTGLWFIGQKHFPEDRKEKAEQRDLAVFEQTKIFLKQYFEGKRPEINIPLKFEDTPFRMRVWKILQEIPYGQTVSYSDIAQRIAKEDGIRRMSCQAVGSAVSANPISIIVPCHRVIGKNGSLTGYAGGLDRKEKLLNLEQQKKSRM